MNLVNGEGIIGNIERKILLIKVRYEFGKWRGNYWQHRAKDFID